MSDLRTKLTASGYKPDCPCFECQNIIGAARIALEDARDGFQEGSAPRAAIERRLASLNPPGEG